MLTRVPIVLIAALVCGVLAAAPAAGVPGQTPKRGGTIVVGRPAEVEPSCLNPFSCTNWDIGDPALTEVLEGAFEFGPDLVPRPDLVTDVTPGRNPPSLTYHVRPEARWSDGTPVTARDFQFTQNVFARYLEDPDGLYRNVLRTRVLDAKTFRVELRQRFAQWRDLYSMILPRHALEGEDVTKVWRDSVDNPKTGQPIGNGPFLISRLERGKQITLVRNPHYWGPHLAYLDRVVQRFADVDRDDPLAPFRENKVDVAFTLGSTAPLSAGDAGAIRELAGWRTRAWPATFMEHFMFRVSSGGHPALSSKLVRRALAYGIDRVAIAREILRDAPASSRLPLDSTVFLPTEPFYQPTWRRYRYDPARARSLLEQAGCRRDSGGVYACGGERLRLRFVTTAGNPTRERVLALAAAQLRQVGVEVDQQFAPFRVLFEQILPGGDFDAALFSWGGSFGGKFVMPDVLCGQDENWSGYCSRLVTRDAQQNLFGDPAARARVLNHLDAKVASAAPVLPVVQPIIRVAYRTNVRGLRFGGSHFEVQQDMENWWLAPER